MVDCLIQGPKTIQFGLHAVEVALEVTVGQRSYASVDVCFVHANMAMRKINDFVELARCIFFINFQSFIRYSRCLKGYEQSLTNGRV